MKRVFLWVTSAMILALIFGTIYAAVQQAQRQGANFPQIQLAEDTAALLDQGIAPGNILSGRVNVVTSLAPFVLIYDKQGRLAGGTGYLGDAVPAVPSGVLSGSTGREYSAVTWQPKDGIRIAAVTVSAKKYYVVSGRSLREVEKSENKTFMLAALGWVLALVPMTAVFLSDEIIVRARPLLRKFLA